MLGGRLMALVGLLGLGISAAFAQMMPPDDFFEWSGAGGNGLWTTGTNWIGGPSGNGGVPTINADVLFADEPTEDTYAGQGYGYSSPLTVENNNGNSIGLGRKVNSLWFETGREYAINPTGRDRGLVLGGALTHDGGHIITSLNNDPSAWQSEHTINVPIRVSLPDANWTATIASYSAGGFRLGGVTLEAGNLRQRGGGAMHIAGNLVGTSSNPGNLTIATDAGHMILSGNSQNWKGNLTVNHGFLVATANNALGSTTTVSGGARTVAINGTWSGATLAFRPKFVGSELNNSAGIDYSTAQAITVRGQGYLRPWGSADPHDPYSALNLRPIGAVYNDGGNNTFAGNITMAGHTWFGSRDGVLTLSGRIYQSGGNYTFTKVGHGVVDIRYSNYWMDRPVLIPNDWSQTVIQEGVLRVSGRGALPDGIIRFDGGILELGAEDFTRNFGAAGSNRIRWLDDRDGGFSAYGGERTVTLNNGGFLTWGQPFFVGLRATLLLSSAYADSKITLTNNISLNVNTYPRKIRVERGATSNAYAELSGLISSPQGGGGGILNNELIKTGLGRLWLSNSGNKYAGVTTIREGVLGGYVPTSSRIDFDGGVFGIDWTFTRSLGTSSNQIRWLPDRDGGFASYNGTRSVTLGSAGSVVTVGYSGEGHFVNANSYLIFGAYDASGTVAFQNKLGLFSEFHPMSWGPNRIRVINYVPPPGTNPPVDVLGLPNASVDFRYAFETPPGPPGSRDTSYNLYFEGDGRADITQSHAIFSSGSPSAPLLSGWVGDFVKVRGAHLVLRQQGNIPLTLTTAKLSQVEVYHGGSITLDNRSQYVGNRINDAVAIGLYSGKFVLAGNLTTHVTETVNDLKLYLGANTVSLLTPAFPNTPTAFTRTVSLRFNSLQNQNTYWDHNDVLHDDERPTVNFTSNSPNPFAATGWPTGAHRLSFASKPSDISFMLPYATINGKDWARTFLEDGRHYLIAYVGYITGNETSWGGGTNVSPNSNQTLTANRTINSLRLENGRIITIPDSNNRSLRITSGILSTGSATTKIQNGTLRLDSNIYVHVYSSELDISSAIRADNSSNYLVKTGPGILRFSGTTLANIWGGTIYIHEGTLALSKTGSGRVNTSRIIVGDHAGVDVLRLDNHQQIVSTVNLTLRGGHPDPARFLMAEGILRYNGINGSGVGIRQTINNLHIEGRGVVDFRGGEVGRANFLIINGNISFGEDSKLFIRNWYEYEDYILIRRNGAGLVNLDNIVFEGYGPAIFRAWDGIYWQITPAPEPTTYGAILGALGIGLVVWRKRRGVATL